MHNSTAVIGDQNSSKTELILNTNACNAGFSLDDFVTASDETNRLYQLKKRSVFPTTGKAMMTREELFECDTLEDDRFLTALEYQHTYGQPVIVTDLDQSIEDMLKYFNNGVVATHNSTNSTPTKLNTPTVSKVASAVANFRIKAANFTTSSLGRKKMKKPQTSPKVKELKQKYEPAEDLTDIIKPPDSKQPKSTKTPKKSKVKQITKMFNSKITQIMRRDSDNYSPLQNELSPEPKPTPEPLLVAPVAKPRTNRGVFSPVPTARSRHNKVPKSPDHTCLVAEDVFRQLSVKDRVLLYNKFFDDMSTKNPEFGKLAEDMKAKVRKQLTRGEVVNEKQQLVKQLAQELEAKCSISKSTTSFKTVQRMNSANEPKQRAPTPPTQQSSPKAKEGDDLLVPVDQISISDDDHEDLQHVSKLSVVLISSLADAKKNVLPPRPRSRKQRDNRYLHEMCIIEPSHKRSIQSIRSSLPHEAYAPPKKIRRTRMERLAPKMFFESQDMERLFYSWLKEKNGVSFDITATNNDSETIQIASDLESLANSMDNEHQKSAVDRLLEEALAKLEKVEIVDSKEEKADAVEEKEVDTMKSLVTDAFTNDVSIQQSVVVVELPMEIAIAAPLTQAPNIIPRKIKNLPPPVPSPRTLKISESSASSSAKQSEGDDSESGLSSLAKITTTDESQPEQHDKDSGTNQCLDFEFIKPVKPPRKRKMRRNLTWKKDNSIVETKTVCTTTTDSDSDTKQKEAAAAAKKLTPPVPPPKPKKANQHAKKLIFKSTSTVAVNPQSKPQDSSFIELDKSLMRAMNSPRKIKSAYTLTVLSSPSPNTESDNCEPELSQKQRCRETSRSWPSVVAAVQKLEPAAQLGEKSNSTEITAMEKQQQKQKEPRPLADSSIDQGFETGSNELDSPMRKPRLSVSRKTLAESPLFIKLTSELEKSYARRLSASAIIKSKETPSGFSTPVKGHVQTTFSSATGARPTQDYSPIPTAQKTRRRSSIYDAESRRNSLAMQVIREDHAWDHREHDSLNANESHFFANAPTMDMGSTLDNTNKEKTSSFWICAGDFTISAVIFYNTPDRLRLLYDIFSQKSCETRDLHFGIDDNKFSVHHPIDRDEMSKRLPKEKGCSHYWFSTGDLALPFSGKYMCPDKVKRLFSFVADSIEEFVNIRFGVDAVEFSNVPDFWQDSPKYSIESSYSQLVGLQAGNSNGLEGRSKYEWPNPMCCASNNSNINKTSYFYQSDFESEEFSDIGRLSFSPFENKRFDRFSSLNGSGRNSETTMSPEIFTQDYENEPLDQLFEDAKQTYNLRKTQTDKMASEKKLTVPEMLETLLGQQVQLKSLERRLLSYGNPNNMSSNGLEPFNDSPEYVRKLRRIIKAIDNIGRDSGFKACSLQQLESFMFFLCRYADICLDKCSVHMNKIIDTLMEQRAVLPPENELQKSHDHNPATLSEHQLRVQASLQRLNIPDWYQKYNQQTSRSPDGGNAYKPGNFTRKRTTESGRWAGLNSKTTSLSSLGSQRSDRSPLLLSPSAHSHHGGGANATAVGGAHQHHQHHAGGGGGTGAYGTGGAGSFSRWSTSHLNSSQTSPSVSQRGSFSRGGPVNSSFMSVASGNSAVIRNSFRQPYLGWRSTEKLSQRTPHERLASSLLAQQQRTSPTQRTIPSANGGDVGTKQLQAVTPEIQTSIKEVTSAIVHFVNDQTNQQRSRSTSPNSRKCWLESSFVGTRPLDSPQTPVIESTNTFSSATASCNNNNNNNSISSAYLNSSANSSIHSHILNQAVGGGAIAAGGVATNAAEVLRMNGSSCVGGGGAPERSLSTASLEDVLASLLGLPSTSSAGTTDGASANETLVSYRQQQQQHMPQQQLQQQQLLVNQTQAEQQRLRRRSEGDAPTKQQKQQQSKQEQQSHAQQQNATPTNSSAAAATTTSTTASNTARRVSLGDSSESTTACGNHAAASSVKQPNANATSELPIKCRNTKCDRSATAADAKKHYKSCHNCTHLYCTRECRRAHWEKHRKACLHARASNLCRQVLATCKDDLDSQRHLSVLARKGYLAQGRGVVRVLFRSAESAEGFIKHGFQCMGEASYVRWPDLMPAEMGLELYSELLKLSTEYKPDSKMLIYVAICVVSEAPGMGQAPVRWERQLVSRCAKLKLCKTVLGELDQQQAQVISQQPSLAVVAVIPEPTTEILILTFNPALKPSAAQRELILSNILDILSRRGVLLRKHYPEIYQRLQSYSEGQTDKFNPVTLHPRDSHSGQGFVCIIMPVHSDSEIIKLPSAADGGNRVTTIDVGSPAALAQFDDDELLTRSTSTS